MKVLMFHYGMLLRLNEQCVLHRTEIKCYGKPVEEQAHYIYEVN
jgi:hypothetical protein